MKKKNYDHYGSYRAPKTTQEKRIYADHKEYVRGKRSKRALPGTWDDIRTTDWRMRKSWKVKREKQYRVGGRGKRHEIYVESFVREWELIQFFDKHDIPYRSINQYDTHDYQYIDWKTGELRAGKWRSHKGFFITYWTNKNIILPINEL